MKSKSSGHGICISQERKVWSLKSDPSEFKSCFYQLPAVWPWVTSLFLFPHLWNENNSSYLCETASLTVSASLLTLDVTFLSFLKLELCPSDHKNPEKTISRSGVLPPCRGIQFLGSGSPACFFLWQMWRYMLIWKCYEYLDWMLR